MYYSPPCMGLRVVFSEILWLLGSLTSPFAFSRLGISSLTENGNARIYGSRLRGTGVSGAASDQFGDMDISESATVSSSHRFKIIGTLHLDSSIMTTLHH